MGEPTDFSLVSAEVTSERYSQIAQQSIDIANQATPTTIMDSLSLISKQLAGSVEAQSKLEHQIFFTELMRNYLERVDTPNTYVEYETYRRRLGYLDTSQKAVARDCIRATTNAVADILETKEAFKNSVGNAQLIAILA